MLCGWLVLTLVATSVAQRDGLPYRPPGGGGRPPSRPSPEQKDFDFGLTDYGPASADFGLSSFGRPQQDPFAPKQPALRGYQPESGYYDARPGAPGALPDYSGARPGTAAGRPGGFVPRQRSSALPEIGYRPLPGQGGQAGPGYGIRQPEYGRPQPSDPNTSPGFGQPAFPSSQFGGRGGGPGAGQRGPAYSPQPQNPQSRGGDDGFFSNGKGIGRSLFPTLGILNGVGTLGSGKNPQSPGGQGSQGGGGFGGEKDLLDSLGPSARPFDNYRPKTFPPLQQGAPSQQPTFRRPASGQDSPYPSDPYPATPYGPPRGNERSSPGGPPRSPGVYLPPYGRQNPGSSGNPAGNPYQDRGPSPYPRPGSAPSANPGLNPSQNQPPGQKQAPGQAPSLKSFDVPSFPKTPNPFGSNLFGGSIGQGLFSQLPNQGKPTSIAQNPGGAQQSQDYLQQQPPSGYPLQNRPPQNNGFLPPQSNPPQNRYPQPAVDPRQRGSNLYPPPQNQGIPGSGLYQPKGNVPQDYPALSANDAPQGYPSPPANNPGPRPGFNPSPAYNPNGPIGGYTQHNPPPPSNNPAVPRQQGPPQPRPAAQYPPQPQRYPIQIPPQNPQAATKSPFQQPPSAPRYPPPQPAAQYPPQAPPAAAQYPFQSAKVPVYPQPQPRPAPVPVAAKGPVTLGSNAAPTPGRFGSSRPVAGTSGPTVREGGTQNSNKNQGQNSYPDTTSGGSKDGNKPPPPGVIPISFGPAKTSTPTKDPPSPPAQALPVKPTTQAPTTAAPTTTTIATTTTTDKYDFLKPRKPSDADFGLDNLFGFPKRTGNLSSTRPGSGGSLVGNSAFPSFTKELGNDFKNIFSRR